MEFGVPEAIWVLIVEKFPVVVTMDSHGNSIHEEINKKSGAILERLLKTS
jgi:fumarate hydratase class I